MKQGADRQHLVHCEFFDLEYVQGIRPLELGGEGRMQVFIALRGEGRFEANGEEVQTGQVWLLPASMPRTTCTSRGTLGGLLCTLP